MTRRGSIGDSLKLGQYVLRIKNIVLVEDDWKLRVEIVLEDGDLDRTFFVDEINHCMVVKKPFFVELSNEQLERFDVMSAHLDVDALEEVIKSSETDDRTGNIKFNVNEDDLKAFLKVYGCLPVYGG